jgi:hypothetical protein
VPPPRHTWQDRYRSHHEQDLLPAEEFYDLGLLLVGSDWGHGVVPRETPVVAPPSPEPPFPMINPSAVLTPLSG